MTDSTMRGVFAVSTTPFRRDGEQDLDVYAEGVQRVLDAGVDGILALGATGEALTLDPGEREAQVRRLVEVVDGRVPVVVGCMGYRPEAVSAMIADAHRWGASGAMVTPSFYGGLQPEAAAAALAPVLERAETPIMLYNNPGATGVDLLPAHIGELARHESLWSVKETSGAATRVRELREELGDGVEVFVGADGLALEGLTQGASGWVAASAWLTPTHCVDLWRAADEERWGDAVQLWDGLAGPLGRIESDPAFISLIKRALDELGLEQGPVRPPLPTATDAAVQSVLSALRSLGGKH